MKTTKFAIKIEFIDFSLSHSLAHSSARITYWRFFLYPKKSMYATQKTCWAKILCEIMPSKCCIFIRSYISCSEKLMFLRIYFHISDVIMSSETDLNNFIAWKRIYKLLFRHSSVVNITKAGKWKWAIMYMWAHSRVKKKLLLFFYFDF